MVLLFFCIAGAVGDIKFHRPITTHADATLATRSLEQDIRFLDGAVSSYPGVVMVVANDWPYIHKMAELRRNCGHLGRLIMNSLRCIGETKEEAIKNFMASRAEPFVIVHSPEFEFTDETIGIRVEIDPNLGFDEVAATRLSAILDSFGDAAKTPISIADVKTVTPGSYLMEQLRSGTSTAYAEKLRISRQKLVDDALRVGSGYV